MFQKSMHAMNCGQISCSMEKFLLCIHNMKYKELSWQITYLWQSSGAAPPSVQHSSKLLSLLQQFILGNNKIISPSLNKFIICHMKIWRNCVKRSHVNDRILTNFLKTGFLYPESKQFSDGKIVWWNYCKTFDGAFEICRIG